MQTPDKTERAMAASHSHWGHRQQRTQQQGQTHSGNGNNAVSSGPLYSGALAPLVGLSGEITYPHRPFSARCLNCCCAVIIAILCVSGVVAFVTWMAVRPHKPRFFVESATVNEFSLPNNSRIVKLGVAFNVTCRNANERFDVSYKQMEAWLRFERVAVGTATLLDFSQPPKNTTVLLPRLKEVPSALDPGTLGDLRAQIGGGSVNVELRMTARVRFILGGWNSQRYKMRVSCADINLFVGHGPPPPFPRHTCIVYF